MPFDTTLASLMSDWGFGNRIPKNLHDSIHLIRKIGNMAAHGQEIAMNQSEQSLLILYDFLSFFSASYSKETAKKLKFNFTLVPEGHHSAYEITEEKRLLDDQINKLEKKEKELSELRFTIDELKKKNEALALQISTRRKDSIEPDGR